LAAVMIAAVAVAATGLPIGEEICQALVESKARTTPLLWLIGPVERLLAMLGHASSRALVLLGLAHQSRWMIFGGFAIFTIVDGIGGAGLVFFKTHAAFSLWWIELAIVPPALLSVFILRWCYRRWRSFPTTP